MKRALFIQRKKPRSVASGAFLFLIWVMAGFKNTGKYSVLKV